MCAIVAPMRAAMAPTLPTPSAMDRTCPLAWFALALTCACAPQPESNAPAALTPAPQAPSPAATRTANNDARGAGMQPDYAGEAEALRQQITPRLPDPLPAERRTACAAMLDAAVAFYSDIEPEPAARTQLLADLASTRAADLAQCEQTTSVRAATCVQLRLADRDAELPWLLDQCTRAFPEQAASKDMPRSDVVN